MFNEPENVCCSTNICRYIQTALLQMAQGFVFKLPAPNQFTPTKMLQVLHCTGKFGSSAEPFQHGTSNRFAETEMCTRRRHQCVQDLCGLFRLVTDKKDVPDICSKTELQPTIRHAHNMAVNMFVVTRRVQIWIKK